MTTSLNITALIVAAGRGARAGGTLPKQWQKLAGATVAEHTVGLYQRHPAITQTALVIHPDDAERARLTGADHLIRGGASRDASVLAGLEALGAQAPDLVLIHDVARPLVSHVIISDVIDALNQHLGAAPALPVTDALWRGADGVVTGTQDRAGLYRAQTPQGFHFDAILAAHRAHPGGALDDVEVARHAGLDVAIVAGDERNIKITHPNDFARAERLLNEQRKT